MKKLLALLFVLLLGLGMLGGCAAPVEQPDGPHQEGAQPEPQEQPSARNAQIPQPPALPEE